MLPVQIEDGGDLWRPYMLNLLFYFPPRRRRRRRPGSRTGKGAFGLQLVHRRHHAVCAWAPGDGQHGRPGPCAFLFFFQSEQSAIYRWVRGLLGGRGGRAAASSTLAVSDAQTEAGPLLRGGGACPRPSCGLATAANAASALKFCSSDRR